jgi:hypothetical protein
MTITVDALLAFARTLKGASQVTLHDHKPFRVEVEGDRLEILVGSTGKRRRTDRDHIENVIAKFNKTGSFQPSQYVDLTHNASYVLTLISGLQSRGK